jgi:hypothetical protein
VLASSSSAERHTRERVEHGELAVPGLMALICEGFRPVHLGGPGATISK